MTDIDKAQLSISFHLHALTFMNKLVTIKRRQDLKNKSDRYIVKLILSEIEPKENDSFSKKAFVEMKELLLKDIGNLNSLSISFGKLKL